MLLSHLSDNNRDTVWRQLLWAGGELSGRPGSGLVKEGLTAAVIHADKERVRVESILMLIARMTHVGLSGKLSDESTPEEVGALMPTAAEAWALMARSMIEVCMIDRDTVRMFEEEIVPLFALKADHLFEDQQH